MTLKQPTLTRPSSTAVMAGRMVVARHVDGTAIKGTTQNFLPNRPTFHVYEGGDEGSTAIELSIDDLKAVFFVKTFEGRREHVNDYSFETTKGYGRKCRVTFHDGETIDGYTAGYSPNRPGFFMVPAETDSNNERIFVVNKAVRRLDWV